MINKINFKQAEINVEETGNVKKAVLVLPIVKPETKKVSLKVTGSLNLKKQTLAVKGADLKFVDALQYKKVENMLVKNLIDGTEIKKSKLTISSDFQCSGTIE